MPHTGCLATARKTPLHSIRRTRSVGIALLSVLVGTGCAKAKPPAAPQTAEVTVVTVAARDVPVSVEYVAQTQSSRQVSIQARVSGFLDKRVYTEGSLVKEGDVLFLMDKKPFQVQVDAANAALARQQASLETAKLNLERTRPLTAENALSQKDLEDASGHYQSTAAAVEQAKAELAGYQLNLSYCTITSPVTGVAGAALQQDGTYISGQNSQLTTVAVLSPMWVNFSISENEMQRLRDRIAKGQIVPPKGGQYGVEVLMANGTVFPHRGRITFADPSFNPATGTFLVRASVDNPDGILRPNQHLRARIVGAVRPKAILVPQRSVQQGAKGSFVWVVSADGKAELRPVVAAGWHGDDWFIDEGLAPGDRVVVDGGLTLRAGIPVTVKNVEPGAAPPGSSPPKTAAARTAG
ncbi:MAG: Efflux pump periplasmic linker BepD [Thermoanaerobaculia bacterium]|nr:Efflux pump periplasmic linker BepD [Thermoanaerobaculia bacterium]